MRAAAVILLAALAANAQFKGTATLVVAPTSVTDAAGKYIDGLQPSDFVLYDNGVAQPLQVDESYNPISLVVAVQTSANSDAILDKLSSSGILFSDLLAGDRGETAIVTFSDFVRVAREFTTNADALKSALGRLHVQGTGAVALDAVEEAFRMLATRKQDRRRILLVIGEKRDRSSKAKLTAVLREAQQQNVLVYWLTYSPTLEFLGSKEKSDKEGNPLPPETGPQNLLNVFPELGRQGKPDTSVELAGTTGGRALGFLTKDALEEAIQAVAGEVHRQYIVSFTPPAARAGQFHSLRITIKGHPEWTARTRAGYWSL